MNTLKRFIIILLTTAFVTAAVPVWAAKDFPAKPSRGVWVTVFSEKRVHFSKKRVSELVSFCAANGIEHIYFQIYRAGEAWYDSRVAGRKHYNEMVAAAGCDPIDFLIDEARERGIQVHAWINVLSIAQNFNAPVIAKYGRDILTRDQRGRLPYKYNQGEDQIFLEPGDERVVRFTMTVVNEIIVRYPGLTGLHLDYIRYAKGAPPRGFLFMRRSGVTYGYGQRNVARYRLAAGKDPWGNPWSAAWAAWKKKQVSSLAEKIRAAVRERRPEWKVSCAVIPSPEKAAALTSQEWPQWLKRGTVDYVVLMNYTKDPNAFIQAARLASAAGSAAQVHVGIAVYMLKNMTWTLQKQLRQLEALNPAGIVFFAYDDICRKGITHLLSGSSAMLKGGAPEPAKKKAQAKKSQKIRKARKAKRKR